MRNMILTLAIAMAATATAQVLEVEAINRFEIEGAKTSVVAGISPQGDYILLTGARLNGLAKYDLATQKMEVITDALSAGYNASISADGTAVAYREDHFDNGLRISDVKVKNFATGESREVATGIRNLNAVSLEGTTAVTIASGRSTKKAIGSKRVAKSTAPSVSIVDRQLVLTKDGTNITLSPNGTDRSYLWPSLSPDGTKICYYLAGTGCCVCDLKGNILARLGQIRAAKWYDNATVVGMHDTDDGHVITASEIVAASLDGQSQVLTPSNLKAMYPYASGTAKKIVFTTDNGEIYIINLK